MALKVHKVVVVSCPRCVFGSSESEGIGKSCFCNRFVRPDCFSMQHHSRLSEDEWQENSVYNGDHFLYWGAATKRLHDGTRARFHVVEQTEFYDSSYEGYSLSHDADQDYIARATSTHFISRGKIAYRLHSEEEYAIPSSLKHNTSARATQLFPNNEFSEGKANVNFICLYDPTLVGNNETTQMEYLTKLIKELVKNKCKVVIACTKCDAVDESKIQIGANFAATVIPKKPIPFIETSAKENINIEQTFLNIVSSSKKKKGFAKSGGGKTSPANLAPSYQTVIQSRSQDETYAMTTFNQIMKDSVTSFSTEWSDIWPLLQSNPTCAKAVDVLGIENARNMFCQHLIEFKVQELRGIHRQNRKLSKQHSSKGFQNELLESFSNHPDLLQVGNVSVYDIVYSPSPTSTVVTTPVNKNSPTPVSTPTHPNNIVSSAFPMSPPIPPPTSSIPSLHMDQTTPSRTAMFSPTHTCQNMTTLAASRLNKSIEFLATLPQVNNSNILRTSSLRYRTLPPLPVNENFFQVRPLSGEENTVKSNPYLDTDSASNASSSTLDKQKRLSSSMDCLLTSGTLFEEDEEQDVEYPQEDIDASPYIEPIKVRQFQQRPIAASMKITRPKIRPPIPLLMDDTSIGSRPNSLAYRSVSPPPIPPPPTKLYHKSSSPLLLGITATTPGGGETSLDFMSDHSRNGGSTNKLNGADDDNVSIKSGPFTEIDDNVEFSPSRAQARYRSKSHTPELQRGLPNRRGAYSATVLSKSGTNDKENLYASIPADDQYLTMKHGISAEELLTDQGKQKRSASVPEAQKVIKKLKDVASRTIDLGHFGRHNTIGYMNPVHKISEVSMLSSVFDDSTQSLPSSKRPSIQSNASVRPLPPSPTKVRRVSPSKRKTSGGDDNNIYESIDENESWLQELRASRHREKMEQVASIDPELAIQCNTIMESFLKIPQVIEMWNDAVCSVLPNFQPPKKGGIPPFTINPEYIISYGKPRVATTNLNHDIITEEATDIAIVPDNEVIVEQPNEHRKLTVTDSVLVRMNRSLNQGSTSSEESDESDDADSDREFAVDVNKIPEEEETWPDTSEGNLSMPLAVIHQTYDEQNEYQNNDIVLDNYSHSDNSSNEDQTNSISYTDNYVVIEPDDTSNNDSNPLQHYNHVVQNGHLSVCQLNSLDSGISASNGVSDEIVDLH